MRQNLEESKEWGVYRRRINENFADAGITKAFDTAVERDTWFAENKDVLREGDCLIVREMGVPDVRYDGVDLKEAKADISRFWDASLKQLKQSATYMQFDANTEGFKWGGRWNGDVNGSIGTGMNLGFGIHLNGDRQVSGKWVGLINASGLTLSGATLDAVKATGNWTGSIYGSLSMTLSGAVGLYGSNTIGGSTQFTGNTYGTLSGSLNIKESVKVDSYTLTGAIHTSKISSTSLPSMRIPTMSGGRGIDSYTTFADLLTALKAAWDS